MECLIVGENQVRISRRCIEAVFHEDIQHQRSVRSIHCHQTWQQRSPRSRDRGVTAFHFPHNLASSSRGCAVAEARSLDAGIAVWDVRLLQQTVHRSSSYDPKISACILDSRMMKEYWTVLCVCWSLSILYNGIWFGKDASPILTASSFRGDINANRMKKYGTIEWCFLSFQSAKTRRDH